MTETTSFSTSPTSPLQTNGVGVGVAGTGLGEGDIAEPLGALAKARPEVSFGSYPWMRLKGKTTEYGVNLVARSRDPDLIAAALLALVEIVEAQGVKPEIDPKKD